MVERRRSTEHGPTWNRDGYRKGESGKEGGKEWREREEGRRVNVASCLSLCLPLLWWWVYTGSTSPISKSVQGSAGAHKLATSCRCWLALWVSTTPPRDTRALVFLRPLSPPRTDRFVSLSLDIQVSISFSATVATVARCPSSSRRREDIE